MLSDKEYPGVTVNMTGRDHAQSVDPRHTHSHVSQLPLPNYDRVNAKAFEAHSTIAASLASSFNERPASVDMAGTS